MGEDRLREAVLTGSAAARRPVSGCRCPHCLPGGTGAGGSGSGPGGGPWSAPSGLLLPGLLQVDGDDGPAVTGPDLPRLTTRTGSTGGPATRARRLRAGERTEVAGVRVIALPAGQADAGPDPDPDRVVLVLGSGPRTLLWAAGSGPLPEVTLEALGDAGLDAAVIGVATGDRPATGDGPATDNRPATDDRLAAAHQVARLRRARALADGAVLIAADLPHTGPTPRRFARTAANWGLRVLPDGAAVWPADGTAPDPARREREPESLPVTPPLPHRTVVLGGAGSGKSLAAEALLAALPEVVYVATGPQPETEDAAWAARVAAHRQRRPAWWGTVEGGDLAQLLATPGPPLLVDSLGTWLTAELDAAGCWDDRPGWQDHVAARTHALVAAWRQAARPVVAVAEEVGGGVVPVTPGGARFRDALGRLNQRLCDQSERVLLVVAGRTIDLDPPVPPDRPWPDPEGIG